MSDTKVADISRTTRVAESVLTQVEAFFDRVLAPVSEWIPDLVRELTPYAATGMTGQQLAQLLLERSHQILERAEVPLYGAGFCASDALVTEGNPLAWWQGSDRQLLASSTFGPGQAAIDLERLEWYRVPRETRAIHIAGPYVDYLCSNEVTITSAIPVIVDDVFWGVACADVLVADVEQLLLPRVAGLAEATLVNAAGRVVVSSSPDFETGDRFTGADRVASGELVEYRADRPPFTLYLAP